MGPDFLTEFEVDRLEERGENERKEKEKRKNGKSGRNWPPEAREWVGQG